MNMRGNAARTISSLLSAVENEVHVHILHNKHVELAVIELPRLKLDFHVASGDDQIRSRQYRGMVLDEDQNLGTMVGLNSKLVLRQSQSASDRLVLIPEGFVQFSRTSTHHVSVLIRRQGDAVIHAYRLDTTLGRVLDSGALQSKLLLSYLHALTSHCLPDPLTRSTGTEAAVTILRSSAVRSFTGLTLYNMKVLNKKLRFLPADPFIRRTNVLCNKLEGIPISHLFLSTTNSMFYSKRSSITKRRCLCFARAMRSRNFL